MTIRVEFDWVDAPASADALAQSTMAQLTIEVNGCCVTSVLNRRSGFCRNYVVTPLVYVAEWLAGNWWRIFHEVENERTPRAGFAEAHNLAFAGEGFLLPRLTIAPVSDRLRLRWERYQPEHAEVEFTEQGEAYVSRQDWENAAGCLVEVALDRLAGAGQTAEFLQRDWLAIQSADDEEREFCRAAALLGQDPFAVPQPRCDRIIESWSVAEPNVREDALATANLRPSCPTCAATIWPDSSAPSWRLVRPVTTLPRKGRRPCRASRRGRRLRAFKGWPPRTFPPAPPRPPATADAFCSPGRLATTWIAARTGRRS